MFLWQNGAIFENMINKYMSASFSAGIDPTNPAILKVFGPVDGSVDTSNGTLPEGINLSHPASLISPNFLNNISGLSHNTTIGTPSTDTY